MTGSFNGVKKKVYSSSLHKKIYLMACTSQEEIEENYLPALFFSPII